MSGNADQVRAPSFRDAFILSGKEHENTSEEIKMSHSMRDVLLPRQSAFRLRMICFVKASSSRETERILRARFEEYPNVLLGVCQDNWKLNLSAAGLTPRPLKLTETGWNEAGLLNWLHFGKAADALYGRALIPKPLNSLLSIPSLYVQCWTLTFCPMEEAAEAMPDAHRFCEAIQVQLSHLFSPSCYALWLGPVDVESSFYSYFALSMDGVVDSSAKEKITPYLLKRFLVRDLSATLQTLMKKPALVDTCVEGEIWKVKLYGTEDRGACSSYRFGCEILLKLTTSDEAEGVSLVHRFQQAWQQERPMHQRQTLQPPMFRLRRTAPEQAMLDIERPWEVGCIVHSYVIQSSPLPYCVPSPLCLYTSGPYVKPSRAGKFAVTWPFRPWLEALKAEVLDFNAGYAIGRGCLLVLNGEQKVCSEEIGTMPPWESLRGDRIEGPLCASNKAGLFFRRAALYIHADTRELANEMVSQWRRGVTERLRALLGRSTWKYNGFIMASFPPVSEWIQCRTPCDEIF
jgi:hypothetical protein